MQFRDCSHEGKIRLTLTPGEVVTRPDLFYQNESEGCRINHLDGLGHFFGVTGKSPRGGCIHPHGKTKVKWKKEMWCVLENYNYVTYVQNIF